MTNRSISPDVLALRYALECSIPRLRAAALSHVKNIVRREKGSTTRIVERLGISVSTYMRWLEDIPQVREVHQRNRPKSAPGPKPAGSDAE